MAKDPFEADLDGLFAEGAAFDDAEAFAHAVDRRLEPRPSLSPAVRGGLIGLAAGFGGVLAYRSVGELAPAAAGLLRDAQAAAVRLPDLVPGVNFGADPNLAWIALGLAVAGLAIFTTAQEA